MKEEVWLTLFYDLLNKVVLIPELTSLFQKLNVDDGDQKDTFVRSTSEDENDVSCLLQLFALLSKEISKCLNNFHVIFTIYTYWEMLVFEF